MNIKLELTLDEVNAILQTLGNLPTRSGSFNLMIKIEQQAKSQVPGGEQVAE